VFLDVQTLSGGTGYTYWRLLNPNGQAVFEGFIGDVEPLTLGQTGTYTLLLEGPYFATTPEDYTIVVHPVQDDQAALTVNTTVTGAISQPGQVDRYTFTLSQAAQLYVDSLTDNTTMSCR
jgi:hypothetical protein